MMAMAIPQSVKAYDFSYTYNGQTQYYNIVDGNAQVTYEENPVWWGTAAYPSLEDEDSIIIIPSTVTYDGTTCQSEGIGDVDGSSANVIAANGQIVIENADGNTVTLYDAAGHIHAIKQSNNQAVIFDVPASGSYLVKIGSFQARKVVVVR